MQGSDPIGPTVTPWQYIKDNFQPGDRLAVVIKNSPANQLIQRITTAEYLATPRYQAWLRFENARGGDVYLSMNPLKPESHGRTKNDIAVIRHLYLDLDRNGLQSLKAIRDDARLPSPSYILNTSEGKYQVVWKALGHDLDRAEKLQRTMALEYGADRAATDVARVLRIPGFYNRKYEPPFQVTAEKVSFMTYILSDFRIQAGIQAEPQIAAQRLLARRNLARTSQSERDWAETLQRLDKGEPPAAVQAWLERKRQDKHNPAYYAALTVRKALAERENRQASSLTMDLS